MYCIILLDISQVLEIKKISFTEAHEIDKFNADFSRKARNETKRRTTFVNEKLYSRY